MFKKFFSSPVFHTELATLLLSFRKEVLMVGLLSFVVNILMLTPTVYMLQVYDRVMLSQSEYTLATISIILIFLFAVMAISEWLRTRLLVRIGIKFDKLLSRRVFQATYREKLSASPLNAMEAISDMNGIRTFITGNGIFALFDLPWSPFYIYVCYRLHPWLGWTALISAGIFFLMTAYSQKVMKNKVQEAMTERLNENTLIVAKLKNPELVESLGMASKLYQYWMKRHAKSINAQDESSALSSNLTAASKFIRLTQASLVLAVGAWLVTKGELRPSAMIAANLLVARGVQPIDTIVSTWEQFLMAKVSYERLSALLQKNPIWNFQSFPMPPKGKLECRELYAYAEGREEPILKGLNVEFQVGETVAIMGPSGSGKSTLSRCLLGVWPEVGGGVFLDGHDIRDYDREEVGPYIGYLPQNIELFAGSVAENVARFGAIDNEAVIKACQQAGIHQAILALPKGYDTAIWQTGGFLSGGQRQRLGLARALYKDPVLVLLDEPNANLDHEGEQFLFKAILDLKAQGKTVFIVAHTTNVLSSVDKVLRVRDGVIESFGPAITQKNLVQA
jgi:ATP-binding cassette subfamily C exporter for protease/lipase